MVDFLPQFSVKVLFYRFTNSLKRPESNLINGFSLRTQRPEDIKEKLVLGQKRANKVLNNGLQPLI
jgi:hypothetical protein